MTQQLENVQEQPRNRDGELREMTQQLTTVRRQLQERDGQLSEKDRQLRERDEQLTQQLTDVRRQLQERDGQLRNRDGELRQMTQQLTDIRSQLQERDGQLQEKTRQLTNVEGQLEERGGQLRERTRQLTDIRSQLQERDGQLRNRDGELRQMTQQLTDIRSQLQERDGQLQEKTRQLTNVEGQLEERGGQLRERTRQFTNIESQLEDRDRELRETRQQLTNAEEQLQRKDEEVSSLESQLEVKVQQVDELEESLSVTRHAVNELSRQQSPDWVIPRDQIQLTEKCLGRGGWGSVVEGKYCGCSVAVKQMYESILSDYNRGLFEREMDIASRCRHPCLLQFIGASNEGRSPLFVTELLESSLRALLNQRSLSTIEISVISLDVARALNYLHLKKPSPIIHRDISSANVLLWRQGDQWRGKVSDYGTANFVQRTMTACPGANIYSAPEAFTRTQTVKVQCIPDIFKLQLYLFHRLIVINMKKNCHKILNEFLQAQHKTSAYR